MSPPAWGFFTSISLALLGILGGQIRIMSKQRMAERIARRAVINTMPISNGFVKDLKRQLAYLQETMDNHIDRHDEYD